ncbi:heat shock factor protein 2 isoform X3 [Rhineura floridana]|uniref:heat shock factor protein 2 isoform X3 n=1 Tax=Rhineura floridana TaxID=261503 RepID=UPI002AC7EF92|nr:heat shock factor protein 2 isoform X3 [Rhineura floridana]
MKQQQQPVASVANTGASTAVPAFLSKLWALVGDAPSNQLITWSQNGQSFLVLDEQRFAKEILPKYFKHNNMASFVRQLNMYGFRKVVHVDSGIVKLERDGPAEFQHPYFKQGREDLLEHIKRKVSSSRPEENKIRQEDLSKIISSAQKVQIKQETIESRLSALKRENESLWREVAELRAKHLQQQQVIRKIVQFIVTLVQNNQLVSLKRKRPLLLNTNGTPKSNIFQQIVKEPAENKHHVPHSRTDGLKQREQLSDDIIIYDITDDDIGDEEKAPVTPETSEDTTSDSKVELLDYLESIDCSLEDFQAMLSGRQFSIDPDLLVDLFSSSVQMNPTGHINSIKVETKGIETMKANCAQQSTQDVPNSNPKSDKQLVQYTAFPLLAFLDGNPGSVESANLTPESVSSVDKPLEVDELLESGLDPQPTQSKLVRLEPLTEAEASEATLFYLCELAPVPMDTDMPLLNN